MAEEVATTETPEGEKPSEEKKPEEKGGTPAPAEKPEGNEDKPLGEAGEKALAEWKKRAKAAEKQAKEYEQKVAEQEEATKSEHEKALDKARKEAADAAKAETVGEFRKRILRAEIRTAAAGKLADPSDAVALLDLDLDEVFDEDGEVKAEEINSAIADLLERKPHLKADPHDGRPSGDADAGKGSGGAKSPEDMTPEDWEKQDRRNKGLDN